MFTTEKRLFNKQINVLKNNQVCLFMSRVSCEIVFCQHIIYYTYKEDQNKNCNKWINIYAMHICASSNGPRYISFPSIHVYFSAKIITLNEYLDKTYFAFKTRSRFKTTILS